MTRYIIAGAVAVLAFSAAAQDPAVTNTQNPAVTNTPVQQTGNTNLTGRSTNRFGHQRAAQFEQRKQERRLQMMERELKRIGMTDEEKARILELQQIHKKKMEANSRRIAEARKELSRLMNEGASMDVLEEAIQAVSEAQTEQLRICVRNRKEMEEILGTEKHDQFMKNARKQYQKHGRRGGPSLPPRPGTPPMPPEMPPMPPEIPPVPGE